MQPIDEQRRATDQHGSNTDENRFSPRLNPCFIRVRPWPISVRSLSGGLVLVLLGTLLITAFPHLLIAQDKPATKREAKNGAVRTETAKKGAVKKDPEKPLAVTPEREAAVNAFVEQHHPELGELLKHLKSNKNARPYERALRELYAASEKLAGMKKNDAQRYELELKSWKLKSRMQLLSAKLTMGDDDELKQQLKQTLAEQYDVRREVLSLEKHRMHDRLQKIEKELIDYDSRRAAALEKQFQQLTTATSPKGKPANGKKKTTTAP